MAIERRHSDHPREAAALAQRIASARGRGDQEEAERGIHLLLHDAMSGKVQGEFVVMLATDPVPLIPDLAFFSAQNFNGYAPALLEITRQGEQPNGWAYMTGTALFHFAGPAERQALSAIALVFRTQEAPYLLQWRTLAGTDYAFLELGYTILQLTFQSLLIPTGSA